MYRYRNITPFTTYSALARLAIVILGYFDSVYSGLLQDRGANPAKVDAIKPLLLSGFSTAQEQAKTNACESCGAWKALTGETYSSEKAEGWSVELPHGKPRPPPS